MPTPTARTSTSAQTETNSSTAGAVPLTLGLTGAPATPVRMMAEGYRQILEVLDDNNAFTVAQISKRSKSTYCLGHNRVRSGAFRSWLDQLRMLGLVRELDTQKPSAWLLTPKGRAALSKAGA